MYSSTVQSHHTPCKEYFLGETGSALATQLIKLHMSSPCLRPEATNIAEKFVEEQLSTTHNRGP